MSSLQLVARRAGYDRPHRRRSRNGCLTCKRRKVRCNEQRPHCFHCQRLGLECEWKDAAPRLPSPPGVALEGGVTPGSNIAAASLEAEWATPAVDLFDFAQSADPAGDFSLLQDIFLPELCDPTAPRHVLHGRMPPAEPGALGSSPLAPPRQSLPPSTEAEDSLLQHAPPIPDPVENGPMCASLRALLDGMATASPMVRHAIAAFAAVQFCTSGEKVDYRVYYDKAARELAEQVPGPAAGGNELRYVLTTVFFLTYINFLTGRVDLAHSNLAMAHRALQTAGRGALGSVEQRIISWIRWSDARAAVAGGEGLLLNDTSGIYPSTPSSSSSGQSQSGGDPGAHEVIYGMLCQPGIAFFQEVQTITGRITRIAHHHRSRGSVEDETEVMAIAADILRDLSSLYDRRPALMDHAVSGNIRGEALAEPLASDVARSFQTYLANFYVCYIHLHRVAHRHLARSQAVSNATGRIKEIMHFMVANNETIPVNTLWPLFLWGSEEDDEEECQWILETIRNLRHVASNANMVADALQEIQRRQREAGARVDIRSVCIELFNATLAII